MIREMARHVPLAVALLRRPTTFDELIECVESRHFDVASDALSSVRELLTRHKHVTASFLDAHHGPSWWTRDAATPDPTAAARIIPHPLIPLRLPPPAPPRLLPVPVRRPPPPRTHLRACVWADRW